MGQRFDLGQRVLRDLRCGEPMNGRTGRILALLQATGVGYFERMIVSIRDKLALGTT